MTKTLPFAIACLLGLSFAGCSPKTDEAVNASNSGLKSVSTEGTHSASNGAANEPGKAAEPGMDLGKIPAELKGDAFEYYGLGRTDPIKMTVFRDGGEGKEGTQTVKLTKVEKDYAEFTVSSEGALSILGEAVLRLDKSGIKVMTISGQPAGPDTYELPSDVKVGKSWPFKLANNDAKITGVNKVSGTEAVTTPVGTYKDALVVSVTATGTERGQQVKLTSKTWLVKGRGQVKVEISNVEGKTTTRLKMEEAK